MQYLCVFFCATLFMQFVFPRFFLVPEVGGSELSISSEVLRHCVCSQLKQSYISQVLYTLKMNWSEQLNMGFKSTYTVSSLKNLLIVKKKNLYSRRTSFCVPEYNLSVYDTWNVKLWRKEGLCYLAKTFSNEKQQTLLPTTTCTQF